MPRNSSNKAARRRLGGRGRRSPPQVSPWRYRAPARSAEPPRLRGSDHHGHRHRGQRRRPGGGQRGGVPGGVLLSAQHGERRRREAPAGGRARRGRVAAITVLAIQGPRLAGQVRNVGRHLARLLALGAVGGVPSGEPPKNDNRNDKHWWKEVLASLKQIQQAIGLASRKQVLRELLKQGITEEQVGDIATGLSEAAKMLGEDVPPFLP